MSLKIEDMLILGKENRCRPISLLLLHRTQTRSIKALQKIQNLAEDVM
jgi:hypothetical protein